MKKVQLSPRPRQQDCEILQTIVDPLESTVRRGEEGGARRYGGVGMVGGGFGGGGDSKDTGGALAIGICLRHRACSQCAYIHAVMCRLSHSLSPSFLLRSLTHFFLPGIRMQSKFPRLTGADAQVVLWELHEAQRQVRVLSVCECT